MDPSFIYASHINEDLSISENLENILNFEDETIQILSELENDKKLNEIFMELEILFENSEQENQKYENQNMSIQDYRSETETEIFDFEQMNKKIRVENSKNGLNKAIDVEAKMLPIHLIRNLKARESARKYRIKGKIVNDAMEDKLNRQIELNGKLKGKIELMNNLIGLFKCICSFKP